MGQELQTFDRYGAEGWDNTPWSDTTKYLILQAITKGMSKANAAHSFGKTDKEFHSFCYRHPEFKTAVAQAEAKWKGRLEISLVKEGETDAHLALKILERRDRANWGPNINFTALTNDQLLQMASQFAVEEELVDEPEILDEVIDTEFTNDTDSE